MLPRRQDSVPLPLLFPLLPLPPDTHGTPIQLLWYLSGLARSAASVIGALSWVFFAAQLPGLVLSFLYFGVPPMVLSLLVAGILGSAARLAGR